MKLNVLFLCSEVVGYTVGMFNSLMRYEKDINIFVFYNDTKRKSKYDLISGDNRLKYFKRSEHSDSDLFAIVCNFKPEIVYISGWMDIGYIDVIRKYKRKNSTIKVLCGVDDQWRKTVRQYLGTIYFKLFYRSVFDYMWVSGKPQYHYAQRFGYDNHHIISNLYSADETIFNSIIKPQKRLVFLGRFDPVKGLIQLVDAYNRLPNNVKKEWELVLIGDGEQREEILKRKTEYIKILPFIQPTELMEVLKEGGVACMPSIFDQWCVSIHEMALIGYPLLVSSEAGASSEFLINGYNGFSFKANKPGAIDHALKMITSLSNEKLEVFGKRSHDLAKRIDTEKVAASFCSVLYLEK
jgi:glycosyltransferase involved in cell wall biosynthesis